jgi:hypothetical protein
LDAHGDTPQDRKDEQGADRCQTCGKPFGAEDRFCGACGTVRPPRPIAAERSRPTLLPPGWPAGMIAAAAAAIAVLGAVALIAVSSSGKTKHPVPNPATSTSEASASSEQPTSVAQPETGTSTATSPSQTSPPQSATALDAVNAYWADIRAHNFAGAYAYLEPGTVELSESEFIASEQRAQIGSVRFHGRATSGSETTATVEVVSLTTRDSQYGCRRWTGSYEMINSASGWQIARANLSPHSCSG